MDGSLETAQDRATGTPRLSRLPMPRSSAIPKPMSASATGTPTTSRIRAPRESIGAANVGIAELPSSKLRTPAASRLQAPANAIATTGRATPLRTATSRNELRSSTNQATKPRPQSFATPKRPQALSFQKPATPRERPTSLVPEDNIQPTDFGSVDQWPLPADPSEGLLPLASESPEKHESTGFINADMLADDDAVATHSPSVRRSKPRPSLSERTMETLARIPPSPAVRKQSSSFFDQGQGRPSSRTENGASRPGSSYNSDGSGRAHSRQGSRPGSSTGQYDYHRNSNTPFKSSLSTIGGTPRRTSAIGVAKTPQTRATPSRTSMASATRLPAPGTSLLPVGRSPSPGKEPLGRTPMKTGVKTAASKFGQPKVPLQKKMSGMSLKNTTSSSDSKWDGAIAPLPSAKDQAGNAPSLTNRKSSAALRDQIAKAKAAKWAAMKQAAGNPDSLSGADVPVASFGDVVPPGLESDDPFNLKKGEQAGAKVLQQRAATARTTGRLNIAALGLKEIPQEVMKMYDLESIGTQGGSWAESVDVTRFVAADNMLEVLDDAVFPDRSPESYEGDDDESAGNIFGGLETLDLHGNQLIKVPPGFRRLNYLTSLNLSSNRLGNSCIDIISQMASLRDLKISNNQLSGTLDPAITKLSSLEMLDVHGNGISALPADIENMSRLRILNLSENKIEVLPFDILARLPITELSIRKNKLSGVLIRQQVASLPYLQTLDASANQLTHIVPVDATISLPVAHAVSLSVNRLQCLPDMSSWTSLITLTVDENSISSIPESFTSLEKVRHADFASNDIRVVPPEISRMQSLTMIRLTGNPLRDRKLVSAATDDLKELLAGRLEPPPPYQESGQANANTNPIAGLPEVEGKMSEILLDDDDNHSDIDDDFATPPTSAPQSPVRSRSQTVVRDRWFVKAGGILDLSQTQLSSLSHEHCSKAASQQQVKQIQLHHNAMTSIPESLGPFGSTLSVVSLAHNQLSGDKYLKQTLALPCLRELSLASNQITSLGPLIEFLDAPGLESIDVSLNRLPSLPQNLAATFPHLSTLLVQSNQLEDLDPESVKGLKVVDASSNEISRLNPRLGLLGGQGGLKRLEVVGNRFKVPRWSVLDQGTEATLRWLRGRLPIEEMTAWKEANGEDSGDDLD